MRIASSRAVPHLIVRLLDCLRESQLPQKANGSLPARTGLEQHRPIALAPAERAIGAFAVVLV